MSLDLNERTHKTRVTKYILEQLRPTEFMEMLEIIVGKINVFQWARLQIEEASDRTMNHIPRHEQ